MMLGVAWFVFIESDGVAVGHWVGSVPVGDASNRGLWSVVWVCACTCQDVAGMVGVCVRVRAYVGVYM